MKKILLSLLSIGAVAVIAVAATGAFFSDTEESVGNTLQAGAIDLKVDNTCYYNGRACVENNVPPADPPFVWEGTQDECTCTWASKDLEEGDLFFELSDIKPGDWEEDTISLQVLSNEAWLCADVHLTSDLDVDCTEPESESSDPECNQATPTPGAGELADRVNFLWWADDGDNVLENDETSLPSGPLGVLNVSQTANVTLADSSNNIWTGNQNDPIPQGGGTWFIGKAWCFGNITPDPVLADRGTADGGADDNNGPNTPTNADNPTVVTPEDGGFNCDGRGEGNETQTDKFTANIAFRAVQARNNSPFSCRP